MAWVLIAVGLFSIACSALNATFFMQHRKAQFFVGFLGVTGARIFYLVLGTCLAGLGAAELFGVLPSD